jgi:hypothetical protein
MATVSSGLSLRAPTTTGVRHRVVNRCAEEGGTVCKLTPSITGPSGTFIGDESLPRPGCCLAVSNRGGARVVPVWRGTVMCVALLSLMVVLQCSSPKSATLAATANCNATASNCTHQEQPASLCALVQQGPPLANVDPFCSGGIVLQARSYPTPVWDTPPRGSVLHTIDVQQLCATGQQVILCL